MQKLPFETIIKSICLDKETWVEFNKWLKSQSKTLSKWVREKIAEELK